MQCCMLFDVNLIVRYVNLIVRYVNLIVRYVSFYCSSQVENRNIIRVNTPHTYKQVHTLCNSVFLHVPICTQCICPNEIHNYYENEMRAARVLVDNLLAFCFIKHQLLFFGSNKSFPAVYM